jgi:hypothetical protein
MIDCAEQPYQPLRELEVFVGFIMNKSGAQTHRQRDRYIKLKDEFERITAWITREMRNPTSISGYTSELDALELCLACLCVSCEKEHRESRPRHRSSTQDIESFKIVAAAALMRELTALERARGGQEYVYGGGYVGVSGGHGRAAGSVALAESSFRGSDGAAGCLTSRGVASSRPLLTVQMGRLEL